MTKVVLAMPVFNESSIIRSVVSEYIKIAEYVKIELVLVDDKSTDGSYEILKELATNHPSELSVYQNETNQGHGKTLCRALKLGLEKKPALIASCDGDGPISGADLLKILEGLTSFDILEISRKNRVEPLFRKVTTQLTRILVLLKSGKTPTDANTPLRIYEPYILAELLPRVSGSRVPNLLFSILARRRGLTITNRQIVVVERKLNQTGTMWGKGITPRNLPNARFIKFAMMSFIEVLRFNEK